MQFRILLNDDLVKRGADGLQFLLQDLLRQVAEQYYDERLKNLEGRFSFAMIDMDNFKHINDRFGHQAGDAALYRAAQAIKSQIRSDDELVRYGGAYVKGRISQTIHKADLAMYEAKT